ncbi:hypothetical protein TrLO_g12743 [Triparma laevis f. longispina]|uniref:Uncharacterized protein n=1 Tax=Triparma laevis f. longispina TaxID=1714387 RepID=A0A9W7DQK6_9STRA|nr:hypothetical protein TrLO_g12743 [Triparma laevis f. longispina]
MTFLETPEFKRHFIEYVHPVILLVLRRVCKPWQRVTESHIKKLREQGVLELHQGEDTSQDVAKSGARKENMTRVTQVIFFQNVTRIGLNAFVWAQNLVVVDIPEGISSIGPGAFGACRSLTIIFFPTTLKAIGGGAFVACYSLENIDLLHTNLQLLGASAFQSCKNLTSVMIPDSLQTLGKTVFLKCSKLVPSYIDVSNENNDTTSEVLKYLYEKMKSDHMAKDIKKIIVALKSSATADQTTKIASLEAELKIARLELRAEKAEKQNAELRASKEIASLKQQLTSPTDSKKRKHN